MGNTILGGTTARGACETWLPIATNHYKSICVCVGTQWEGQGCMFAPSGYKTSGCCIANTCQRVYSKHHAWMMGDATEVGRKKGSICRVKKRLKWKKCT